MTITNREERRHTADTEEDTHNIGRAVLYATRCSLAPAIPGTEVRWAYDLGDALGKVKLLMSRQPSVYSSDAVWGFKFAPCLVAALAAVVPGVHRSGTSRALAQGQSQADI